MRRRRKKRSRSWKMRIRREGKRERVSENNRI